MTKRKPAQHIDWDVDKYRCEFEPENHWNLRKRFMEAHRDKYSEDRVVSLAQLFINIECLGCRYPEKAMDLIRELSREVAHDFREEQKGKLQRTMVGASDVAEARAKGTYNLGRNMGKNTIQFVAANSTCENKTSHNTSLIRKEMPPTRFVYGQETHMNNHCSKSPVVSSKRDNSGKPVYKTEDAHIQNYNFNKNKIANGQDKEQLNLDIYKKALNMFDKNCDDCIKLLAIAQHLKMETKFEFENANSINIAWCCICSVGEITTKATDSSKKSAKSIAVKKALDELKISLLNKLSASSSKNNFINNPTPAKSIQNFVNQTNNSDFNPLQNKVYQSIQNNKPNVFEKVLKIFDEDKDPSIKLHSITQHLKMSYKLEYGVSTDRTMPCRCVCVLPHTSIEGKGLTKKLAKSNAAECALPELKKYIITKLQCSPSKKGETFQARQNTAKNSAGVIPNARRTNQFVKNDPKKFCGPPLVLILRQNDVTNYCSMLFEAVSFTKKTLDFESAKTKDGKTEVSAYMDRKLIVKGIGDCVKSAKENACQKAFEVLQKTCYTLKVKHTYVAGKVIDSSTILGGTAGKETISNENIGNKLLRMMGWQGGGLGKEQQGIAAPIDVKHQSKRYGLGHAGEDDDFKDKLEDLYQNFIQSKYGDNDLVFSNVFSKEQREQMHKIAQKFGLKSHSYGSGANRHLVVSVKKKPWEIVQELLNGRQSSKYELILPKNA